MNQIDQPEPECVRAVGLSFWRTATTHRDDCYARSGSLKKVAGAGAGYNLIHTGTSKITIFADYLNLI